MNKNISELKQQKDISLQKLKIQFRYCMGIAEVFAPIFIQSIPAALTIVSIGNLFPTLLHIEVWLAWTIAGFVGLGMELLGLVSVDVYFEARAYNQKYKDDLEKAPAGAALLVMMVYAVTALLIVVFLKMFSTLAIWSLIPLTLMSILIVSAVTMKKRLDELVAQKERVQEEEMNILELENAQKEIAKIRAELEMNIVQLKSEQNKNAQMCADLEINSAQLKNERAENAQLLLTIEKMNIAQIESERAESAHFSSLTPVQEMNIAQKGVQKPKVNIVQKNVQIESEQKMSKEEKMNMLIAHLIEHYDGVETEQIKPTQLAQELPLDRSTVTRYLEKLKSEHKLNGHVDAQMLR
jgi:hypothetical protein